MKKIGICIALIFSIIMLMIFNVKEVKATPSGQFVVTYEKVIEEGNNAEGNDIYVGNKINVTVEVNSSTDIYTGYFNIVYDASKFKFVKGDTNITGSSYAGVIPIQMQVASSADITTQKIYEFTLEAIETGSVTIGVEQEDYSIISFEGEDDPTFVPMTFTDTTMQIYAAGSNDATLSSLQVVGGTMYPDFSKWVTTYTANVSSTTTSVDVVAITTRGDKVEVIGNVHNLEYGNNVIKVVSYAPRGNTITYTITINRPEPVTEPITEPTTEPITEPTTEIPKWTEVVVDGISYNINSDFTSNMAPAGFEAVIFDYKDNQVLAATNPKSGLNLFYLVDGMENGKFFIYDADKDAFYDYVQVDSIDNKYVIIPLDKADITPPDTTKGKVSINGFETDAYIDDENKDFAYFYAVNADGTYGWYSYDMIENTIQRFVFSVEEETTTITTEEDTTEETTTIEIESENDTYDWVSENEALKAENNSLTNIRNIAIIVAGVLLVVLVALIVILLANKSEKRHSIGMDNIDYAGLEEQEDEEEESESNDLEDENLDDKDSKNKSDNKQSEKAEDESLNEQAATRERNLFDEAIANSMSRAREVLAKDAADKATLSAEENSENKAELSAEENFENKAELSAEENFENKAELSAEEDSENLDIAIEEIIMTDEILQDASDKKTNEEIVATSENIQKMVQQDEDDEDFL